MRNQQKELLILDEEMDDFKTEVIDVRSIDLIKDDNIIDEIAEKNLSDGIETEELVSHKKKNKKHKPKKGTIRQTIFCIISIAFILGCIIFYGLRLIKYYKIYNPKTDDGEAAPLLGSSITKGATLSTEGSGLYRVAGSYIFKGNLLNNYIVFGNQLWRISKINKDGSIDLILNEPINALKWNKDQVAFKDSDVYSYLNEVYAGSLNKELLATTTYCTDEVTDINNITCDNSATSNVRLLSISEFLNSKIDDETYISSDDLIWLYNHSGEQVWHINGTNISLQDSTHEYLIKPVIRIKNSVPLLSGKGTLDEPYKIEKITKELKLGNYVKLGEDTWVVYEIADVVKLALASTLPNAERFSASNNVFDTKETATLAEYLNNTYLNSLSYKDKLVEATWYTGKYTNSYKDVKSAEVKAKVALLNVADMKINNTQDNYYLMTPAEESYVYMYENGIRLSRVTIARNIKPAIAIEKTKVKSGDGTTARPFVLE